ncbi:MAG: hypothetical protein AAGD25_31625 [Cyanobacteria bacterium P01_F01_bin.150]
MGRSDNQTDGDQIPGFYESLYSRAKGDEEPWNLCGRSRFTQTSQRCADEPLVAIALFPWATPEK